VNIQNQTANNVLSALQTPAATEASKMTEAQDRFLKLLVQQLKNQDPMNPLDNAQFTSQLAQINTVEGIEKVANQIKSLSGDFQGLETVQAASLVGRQVVIEGKTLDLYNGTGKAAFELPQGVDHATVSVKDSLGNVLKQIDLGALEGGMHDFNWDGITQDGKAAINGRYEFSVSATANGQPVTATTMSIARVDGIKRDPDGMKLMLGGFSPVALTQVKQFI
jgi:flagellar basal-body rod modification protein FlgD